MAGLMDRLRGMLGGRRTADPVVRELEDAVLDHEDKMDACSIPLKDIPPEVVADIEAEEDFEAILDKAQKGLEFDASTVATTLDGQVVSSVKSGLLDLEQATRDALLSGQLVDGGSSVRGFGVPTPAQVHTPALAGIPTDSPLAQVVKEMATDGNLPEHILNTLADQMFVMVKDDTDPDEYPVADPKGPPPKEPPIKMDWSKERNSDDKFTTVLTGDDFREGAELMSDPEPNAIENALAASQAEQRGNERNLASGEGPQDNKEFLGLINAVQASIGESMANPDFSPGFTIAGQADQNGTITERKPEFSAEDEPLKDPLPQFIRPEAALRRLPEGSEGSDSRAPLDFIRKVLELLRDVFPEVKDKYWILNEVQAGESLLLVTVVIRINAKRDVVISIEPRQSEAMIRTEDADVVLEQTTLLNAKWDDFVGWVSLAKSLTDSA